MKFPLLVLGSLLLAGPAGAQVSEEALLDQILGSPALSRAEGVWLAGRAAGRFEASVTPFEALNQAAQTGWIEAGRDPGAPLLLAEWSHIVLRAFGWSGGLMYSLFPGPRYGHREAVYLELVPAVLPPSTSLSGPEALLFLQRALARQERLGEGGQP